MTPTELAAALLDVRNLGQRFARARKAEVQTLVMVVALLSLGAGSAIAQDDRQRVLAIGASATEIVQALGAADRSVARHSTLSNSPELTALRDMRYIPVSPIRSFGTNRSVDGTINLARRQNAVKAFEGGRLPSKDAAIAAAPDMILVMVRGGGHASNAAKPFDRPAFALALAAERSDVVRRNGLLHVGSRLRAPAQLGALETMEALRLDQIR